MFLSTKQFVLLCLCMIFVSSFLFAQDDMADVKAQIDEMNEAFEEAMLSNNYEALLSQYTDDAISMPSYEPMINGMDAIKASMMKGKNSGMKMTKFDLTTTDVFESGDLVVEIGKYDLTLKMPQMPEPVDDHGKYLTIYEKQDDGTLKVKVETWNTDMNPWENMDKMDNNMENHNMNDKNEMEGTDQN